MVSDLINTLIEKMHEGYVEALLLSLSEEQYDSKVQDESAYLTEIEKQRLKIYEAVLKPEEREKKPDATEMFKIKVKPVESLKFSSNIRRYATFCNDY